MLKIKKFNIVKSKYISKSSAVFVGISAISLVAFGQVNIASCADIQDSTARLVCYDEAATQTQNLPVIRLPRSPANTSDNSSGTSDVLNRTDNFGFEVRGNLSRSNTRTYRVVAAKKNDFTGWTIEFEGGGKWRQVGADDYEIEIGNTYTIRRGSLNSFLLSNSNNNRKIRISRLE